MYDQAACGNMLSSLPLFSPPVPQDVPIYFDTSHISMYLLHEHLPLKKDKVCGLSVLYCMFFAYELYIGIYIVIFFSTSTVAAQTQAQTSQGMF